MARASLEERIRAVLLYLEGEKEAREITTVLEVSVRTLRRWIAAYRAGGVKALALKRPGPAGGTNSIPRRIEEKILRLKQKHPSWGARRIKYQYDIPCDWRTVHRVIKRHHMLVRIKPKPQPIIKRFQRKHVDSMWQGDSFQFRRPRNSASDRLRNSASRLSKFWRMETHQRMPMFKFRQPFQYRIRSL